LWGMLGGSLRTRGCAGGQTGWGLRSLVWANLVGMVVVRGLPRPITTHQRLQHAWTSLVTLVGHARGLIAHQGLRWEPNWLGATSPCLDKLGGHAVALGVCKANHQPIEVTTCLGLFSNPCGACQGPHCTPGAALGAKLAGACGALLGQTWWAWWCCGG